jgi:hypothetical protein
LGTVVDPLIDQLVTPRPRPVNGGDRPIRAKERLRPYNSGLIPVPIPANTDKDELEKRKDYGAFNRYVISVKKGAPGEPIAFVLTRRDCGRKLTEIRNPF